MDAHHPMNKLVRRNVAELSRSKEMWALCLWSIRQIYLSLESTATRPPQPAETLISHAVIPPGPSVESGGPSQRTSRSSVPITVGHSKYSKNNPCPAYCPWFSRRYSTPQPAATFTDPRRTAHRAGAWPRPRPSPSGSLRAASRRPGQWEGPEQGRQRTPNVCCQYITCGGQRCY